MYTVTKDWKDKEFIPVMDAGTKFQLYIPLRQRVEAPNLVPGTGIYWKDATLNFVLGEEDGMKFWAFVPSTGRFEYRVKTFKTTPEIRIKYMSTAPEISVYKVDHYFLYDGYLFYELEDIMVYLYLTSKHDFGNLDMVYYAGKRKYADKLEILDR